MAGYWEHGNDASGYIKWKKLWLAEWLPDSEEEFCSKEFSQLITTERKCWEKIGNSKAAGYQ